MTTTSVALIADVLRRPRAKDNLGWVRDAAPFRTAQDYAVTEYLYRLRLDSLRVQRALLLSSSASPGDASENADVVLHYPIQITGQLLHLGEPLSPLVESSAVYPTGTSRLPVSPSRKAATAETGVGNDDAVVAVVFDFPCEEWLTFPFELCDVPLDAVCALHLLYDSQEIAETLYHVYEISGELCVGQRQLIMNVQSSCEPNRVVGSEELLRGLPDRTHTATLLADFHRGMMPSIPWLDRLSIRQLEMQQEQHGYAALHRDTRRDATGPTAATRAILTLFLPTATTAVFYEPAVARVVDSMADLCSFPAHNAIGSAPRKGDYTQRPFPDHHLFFKEHNLCEAKTAITSRTPYFLTDNGAPPGPKERHQLAGMLRRPPLQLDRNAGSVVTGTGGVGGRLEETRLLWRHRLFLCRDGKYFLPFMRSVEWANTHSAERRSACALLHRWARPPFADVLACLSFYFDRVAPVRQYAIGLLRMEENSRICQLMFQLLQAVRYDSGAAEMANFLMERALSCWEICSTLHTMLSIEVTLERQRAAAGVTIFEPLLHRLNDSLLQDGGRFLWRLRQQHAMHRVVQTLYEQLQQSPLDRTGRMELGNRLLLKRACGLRSIFFSAHREMRLPRGANRSFRSDPSLNPPSEGCARNSPRRDGTEHGGEGGDEEGEEEVGFDHGDAGGLPPYWSPLQRSNGPPPDLLDRPGVVTLATHPGVPITALLPDSLYIFKSAKQPMRLTFRAQRLFASLRDVGNISSDGGLPIGATTTTTSVSPSCLPAPLAMQSPGSVPRLREPSGVPSRCDTRRNGDDDTMGSSVDATAAPAAIPFAVMYKVDDGVRQDQLIVQLLRLMDELLQQDGLQLYLTPYRVIATGPQEGLVEVVPHVTTFFGVQREVLKYLRVYNPTAELLRQAMDRYTRSLAGYSVITFILGIGDRHLENILLTQDGRLLHIDFGYVLGNDPKPFPPPMKISREMVEVLGGPQSTGFTEFKLYCCSAYNTLRKHAALLLHVLLLGVHAEGIPQVSGEGGDPRVNLLKVQEKLRLDLTNTQATQYLQNVIADSVGSIFTNLWDVLHAAAQATRS